MTKAVTLGGRLWDFLGVNLGSDGLVFRERIEEIERNEVLPRPVPSACNAVKA
jgi:hypothetical protein